MRRNKRNGLPNEGVCDRHHTRHSDELFVIRQHKRNGQPDGGVCDIHHMVHSDELFVIRQHKRNDQPDPGVCDIQHAVTRMNCLCWDKRTEMVQYIKMCVIRGKQVCNQKCVRRPIITHTIASNKTYVICSVYTTSIGHWGWAVTRMCHKDAKRASYQQGLAVPPVAHVKELSS